MYFRARCTLRVGYWVISLRIHDVNRKVRVSVGNWFHGPVSTYRPLRSERYGDDVSDRDRMLTAPPAGFIS